ncbi:hypothetical protein LOAG_10579 [Loa loa]|uniref:Uncharacterized protein n=2 Tax=Loa loa TaxID=7209 RepID=A0A1S0TQ62_LOALO|nr:hypothetical protein LOAG_10579 [Loa loa]EFO17920.2 hypothetical protein LOAG_10579 [Loa loa]
MNVCQFLQEVTYAYSNYVLLMVMGRKNDILNRFSDETKAFRLLIGSLVIHGLRLIACAYPVAVLAIKAFPGEILCRIRFSPNPQRGVSTAQARQADNTGFNL